MIDYLFDLEQTYSLNMELLMNILCEHFKNKEKDQLLRTLDHIKILKEKKRRMIDDKLKIRGKILVDKQIFEEAKRIHEENEHLQTEQEDEIRELVENKFCSIKELEKKFQEVDIYMKKHYPNVYSYEILKIVETNENLTSKKSKLTYEIENNKRLVSQLVNENKVLMNNTVNNIEDVLVSNTKVEDKFDVMIKLFTGKIETLKKIKENLTSIRAGFGNPVKPNKRNDNVNLSVIGKRANSRVNMNITSLNVSNLDEIHKTPGKNAFFEQTMIFKDLNNDTTQFGNFMNKTSDLGNKDQLWDLSVINKKDQ